MKTRLISAGIGICIAVGLIILSAYYTFVVDISLSAISVMCLFEGLSAKGLNKKLSIAIPSLMFTLLFDLFYSYSFVPPALVFVWIAALFIAMIFNHEDLVFTDLSHAITMTVLCTLGLWTIIKMYDDRRSIVGLFFIFESLSTPWFADGGAYFGGSFMGKKKLCPKISPKKTVEGAVTGVITGIVFAMLVGLGFEKFFFADGVTVNYLYLAIFGLLGSLISIVGDLSFSLIKRSCGIKDYGSLIPGHGGMLDRFDSVIFTAPILMIFNMFLPIVAEKVG